MNPPDRASIRVMISMPSIRVMQRAFTTKDAAFEGTFVVAVKTNGAPAPGVTDTGAGTTRWTLSDARGGIWIGLGFGAGCGAD